MHIHDFFEQHSLCIMDTAFKDNNNYINMTWSGDSHGDEFHEEKSSCGFMPMDLSALFQEYMLSLGYRGLFLFSGTKIIYAFGHGDLYRVSG